MFIRMISFFFYWRNNMMLYTKLFSQGNHLVAICYKSVN